MRVLLVQPDHENSLGLQRAIRLEPLGLECVAGALRDRHEMLLLDMRIAPDALPAALADFRPHMVGISSTFTVDTCRALAVAQAVKEADARTFVFLGGHHPSLRPADFHHSAVDAVVVGEGEPTTRELANCLEAGGDLQRVPGLVLNRPEGQYPTPARAPVRELDALPEPDRVLSRPYRTEYYVIFTSPVASLETARGCPYRCRFCSVWRFYQKRVRFKSPERVVRELAALREPHVFITDDNFLTDGGRAEEIARLIAREGIRKGYIVQARSDAIAAHAEILARWRDIGLHSVFVGFEKPDQAGLDDMGKQNSVENNERALEVLRRLGIEPTVSFIVDPDWDRGDFAALRNYVRQRKLRRAVFTVLTPLPGTTLFEELQNRLTTTACESFDLLHAVVPTRLPLADFYAELAHLWKKVYPTRRLELLRLYLWLSRAWSRGPHYRLGRRVLAEAERLADARSYSESPAQLPAAAPS